MKTGLKWLRRILGGLVVTILVVITALYFVGGSNLNRTYEIADAALTVINDSTSLARGEYLSRARGCTDCHGSDLGGREMFDAPPFRVIAPNLTSGGALASATDSQLEKAIRHGISIDGTALFVMPAKAFHGLSDVDVSALIAYLRSVPPVQNNLESTSFKLLGRILASGPIDPGSEVNLEASPTSHPEIAPTAEFGEYVMSTFCSYCHGANGEGVEELPLPDAPPGPPLTAAANWPLDQFMSTVREGVTPAGRELDGDFMPTSTTAHMSDIELEAIYTFLNSQ